MKVPSLTLNTGTAIPQIGFGTWKLKHRTECMDAVAAALTAGYRHFDTAQIYGNEQYVGEAIAASSVERQDVFITTKISNGNQKKDKVAGSFYESLNRLKTDYVDLLLLHYPVTESRKNAWKDIEGLYNSGHARAVGVSNYTMHHLEELLAHCEIMPAVNQVELHVFLQQPELINFCQENNIVVEAYSPLAHGYGIQEGLLVKLAEKHHRSPAQIMLRWCIEMGTVPLPKSSHAARIEENLAIFDFTLDEQDHAHLATLERNFRTCWDPTSTP